MKLPRFTTKTILLITASIGIALGGLIGWGRMMADAVGPQISASYHVVRQLEFDVAIVIPIAFFAYLIGRRSVSIIPIIIFALLEAIALAFSHYMYFDRPW